jgi:hypothetical protein
MMWDRLVVLTLFSLILGFTVTGYAQEGAKPPLSGRRIAGEFFAGAAGGTAAAVISFYLSWHLVDRFFPREPGSGPAGGPGTLPEVLAYLCLPVGYAIGSAAGVYFVGNIGNETGSFKYTLVGTSLVVVGGLVAAFLSEDPTPTFLIGTLVSVPAVATIIFNSTRRYKGNSGSGNTTVGQMRF